MLLHACDGFPGASRPSRGPPGEPRAPKKPPKMVLNEKCAPPGTDGQAGLGHPPWRGGGFGPDTPGS